MVIGLPFPIIFPVAPSPNVTLPELTEKHLNIVLLAFNLGMILLDMMLVASGFQVLMKKLSVKGQKNNQTEPKLDDK